MPAALAAAASASISAPCSVGSRRLMIDANPIFLISGTASAFVAPAHATVVSTRANVVTPGRVSFFTFCAPAGLAYRHAAARTPTAINRCDRIMKSPSRRLHHTACFGLFLFDRDGHRRGEPHGDGFAWVDGRRTAFAGHHGARA